MPLDQALKSALRDKVSTANKTNVDDIAAQVQEARATLAEDDKDYARLGGWLDDLEIVKGGKVIGRFGDTIHKNP